MQGRRRRRVGDLLRIRLGAVASRRQRPVASDRQGRPARGRHPRHAQRRAQGAIRCSPLSPGQVRRDQDEPRRSAERCLATEAATGNQEIDRSDSVAGRPERARGRRRGWLPLAEPKASARAKRARALQSGGSRSLGDRFTLRASATGTSARSRRCAGQQARRRPHPAQHRHNRDHAADRRRGAQRRARHAGDCATRDGRSRRRARRS